MMDQKCFNTLYQTHYARLKKMAMRATGREDVAEDLVQETFLILLYRHDGTESHPNYAGWLVRTIQNLISNELNRACNKLEMPLFADPVDSRTENTDTIEELLPSQLDPAEREILLLHFKHELSHREISERLHIPEGASRTRVYRAKEHLRKILTKNKISCDKTGVSTNNKGEEVNRDV